MGTARRSADVARTDLVEARRTIALAVVNAMLSTNVAERVAQVDRVRLRASLERLVLTQTTARVGNGTELDIDRAEEDVASARALVISADESLRQTREALGVALGSRRRWHHRFLRPGELDDFGVRDQ